MTCALVPAVPMKPLLVCALVGAVVMQSAVALADDTITHPGDHPQYAVELEPHAVWGWTHYNYAPTDGFGLGARFSIPIVSNGFVSTINNNVAIGFGIDWLHYSGVGCYDYNYEPVKGYPCYGVGDANYIFLPVVMQWNFFVAQKWSVFGEPGLVVYHGWFDYCAGAPAAFGCANPSATGVDFAFFVGGRYHFNEHVSLAMRIGYPDLSIGLSFW